MPNSWVEKIKCPKCQGNLELNEEGNRLTCLQDQLAFVVRDSVPIMLLEQAASLDNQTLVS